MVLPHGAFNARCSVPVFASATELRAIARPNAGRGPGVTLYARSASGLVLEAARRAYFTSVAADAVFVRAKTTLNAGSLACKRLIHAFGAVDATGLTGLVLILPNLAIHTCGFLGTEVLPCGTD